MRPFFVLTNPYATDPTKFSIIHDIYQHTGSAVEPSNVSEQGYLILSVEYRFSYPESPYPSPQLSPIGSSSSVNSSLPSPTSFNGVSLLVSATLLVRLTDISISTNTPPTSHRYHATNGSTPHNPTLWICATPIPIPCLAHMNLKCTTGPPSFRVSMAPRACVPANHHSRRSCLYRRHI